MLRSARYKTLLGQEQEQTQSTVGELRVIQKLLDVLELSSEPIE